MKKIIILFSALAILLSFGSCRQQETEHDDFTKNETADIVKRNADTLRTPNDSISGQNGMDEGDPPPKGEHHWRP